MKIILVATCSLLLTSHAMAASPPELVADFNTASVNPSYGPVAIRWVDGSAIPTEFVLLRSSGPLSGDPVLFITDGTGPNTRPIRGTPRNWTTVYAARNSVGRIVLRFETASSQVLCYALDPINGITTQITELPAGGTVLPVGDRFLLPLVDDDHGRELWFTDANPAGPSLAIVTDLVPGTGDAFPVLLTGNGARVFFTMTEPGSGVQLLGVSGGASGDTRIIGRADPAQDDAYVGGAATLGTGLLYTTTLDGVSFVPFFTDGEVAAVTRLLNASGQSFGADHRLISTGNRVVMTGYDPDRRLYISDGASAGTFAVPGGLSLRTTDHVVVAESAAPLGWRLFYAGRSPLYPSALGVTDGTAGGTTAITEPFSLPTSQATRFVVLESLVYLGTEAESGYPIYNGLFLASDGTSQGTREVAVSSPSRPFAPAPIAAIGGRVLVSGEDSLGRELWSFSSATQQFELVADLFGPLSPGVPQLAATDGRQAVISARTAANSPSSGIHDLFVTDGSSTGTTPLTTATQPIRGGFVSLINPIGHFAGRMVFFARNPEVGVEPFEFDTASGALRLFQDLKPGPLGPTADNLSSYKATSLQFGEPSRSVFVTGFVGTPPSSGAAPVYSLWSTQGDPGDIQKVADFRGGSAFREIFRFVELNGAAIFLGPPSAAELDSAGVSLWATDGTTAGTRRIATLTQSSTYTPPFNLVRFGEHVYFAAAPILNGEYRLYRSDGTAGGTGLVALGSPLDSIAVSAIYATDTGLYVTGRSSNGVRSFWRTDGTPGGTVNLSNSEPEGTSSSDAVLADAGRAVLFTRWTQSRGRELWSSDGTREGTRLISDLSPGPQSTIFYAGWRVSAHRVLFLAHTPDRGGELWQSDGTSFGTRPIGDVRSGPSGIDASLLTLLGNRVLLTLDDLSGRGRELWVWAETPPCRCDVDNSGATGIQDIFNYLSLYFTGNGDINADGQTTVQDIFDFLNCWFTGCV